MERECTDEQKQAIEANTHVPLEIIACPGSGKTFTIIHRVAYLLNHGYNPSNLLIITFTRKSAGELRDRLIKLGYSCSNLSVLTFHAFGLRVLRRFGHLIGRNNFRVLSQFEQTKLLSEMLDDLATIPGYLSSFQNKLYKYKTDHYSFTYKSQSSQDSENPEQIKFFSEYEKTLLSMNCVDYVDLIALPLHLFNLYPEVLHYYQRKFSYGLVDEIQDVSSMQFEMICKIFGDRGFLTIVGDDDQTIYSWRGADSSLMQKFTNRYPNAQVVKLTKCFRCSPQIINACKRLIMNNGTERVKKVITSGQSSFSRPSFRFSSVKVIATLDPQDEAKKIISEIRRIHDGKPIAILYRRKKDADTIKKALKAENIAVNISNNNGITKSAVLQSAFQIIQMIAGRDYNKSFVPLETLTRVLAHINKSKNFISSDDSDFTEFDFSALDKPLNEKDNIKTQQDHNITISYLFSNQNTSKKSIESFSDGQHILPNEKLHSDSFNQNNYKKTSKNFEETKSSKINEKVFSNHKIQDLGNDHNREEIETAIISQMGKMTPKEVTETLIQALNLQECSDSFLLSAAADRDSNLSISDFADSISLFGNELNGVEPSANIRLSTAHQAKGLEWNHVFVIGMSHGIWPSTQSGLKKIPEERRLFYVAMSRAKESLTITFHTKSGPSMFISELPEVGIEWVELDTRENEILQEKENKPDLESFSKKFPNLSLKFTPASQQQQTMSFLSAKNLRKYPESQ